MCVDSHAFHMYHFQSFEANLPTRSVYGKKIVGAPHQSKPRFDNVEGFNFATCNNGINFFRRRTLHFPPSKTLEVIYFLRSLSKFSVLYKQKTFKDAAMI